jgi:hypothetical protein
VNTQPPKTLAQALADEMAYAMDDIRHKLIEQPAFGQELTGDAVQLDIQNMRHTPEPMQQETGNPSQTREVAAVAEDRPVSLDIPHMPQSQGMDID